MRPLRYALILRAELCCAKVSPTPIEKIPCMLIPSDDPIEIDGRHAVHVPEVQKEHCFTSLEVDSVEVHKRMVEV